MVVTKVSDVSDLLIQARQNPHKSFPAILKFGQRELRRVDKVNGDYLKAEMVKLASGQ